MQCSELALTVLIRTQQLLPSLTLTEAKHLEYVSTEIHKACWRVHRLLFGLPHLSPELILDQHTSASGPLEDSDQ